MGKLVSENPFYGMVALKSLMAAKGPSFASQLGAAFKEATSKLIFKQLFHIICFSMGDINNRHHNIFGKADVVGGGQSLNENWIIYLKFLLTNDPAQFIKFLPLIVEYVGLRELTTLQVRTQRKTKKVTGNWGLLEEIMRKDSTYNALLMLLIDYSKSNNPFKRMLVAKFVKIPRYSARKTNGKKRPLESATVHKMNIYKKLLMDLSAGMEWKVTMNDSYVDFTGYREFQKQYNKDLEYVLFSTNKISEFDQEQFTAWLNGIPAGARYRVKRRLFDKDGGKLEKWGKLSKWYAEWDKSKQEAQSEKRELEVKAKSTKLSFEDEAKLAVLNKTAKVTTGGQTLFDSLEALVNGKADRSLLNSILDKITFNVPILPVFDGSGSMNGRPTTVARLITTLALLKNPHEFSNVVFGFGTAAYCFTDGSEGRESANRFMVGESVKLGTLVDRKKDFADNFNNVGRFVNSSYGSTDLSSLPERIRKWTDSSEDSVEKAHRIEQLQAYPVVLVSSDGDLNSSSTQAQSMNQFIMKMKQWFSWEPIVVLWEVPREGSTINKSGYFDNIQNVIHTTTWNATTINNIFTKITDMDVIDTYTELNSTYQLDRYKLVKENTL